MFGLLKSDTRDQLKRMKVNITLWKERNECEWKIIGLKTKQEKVIEREGKQKHELSLTFDKYDIHIGKNDS